jgi:large subunit ribosomal protein L32
MALPKYKTSKSNKRTRKAAWKVKPQPYVMCPNCGAAKLPHHICKVCGFYKGEQIIEIKEKKKKEE